MQVVRSHRKQTTSLLPCLFTVQLLPEHFKLYAVDRLRGWLLVAEDHFDVKSFGDLFPIYRSVFCTRLWGSLGPGLLYVAKEKDNKE